MELDRAQRVADLEGAARLRYGDIPESERKVKAAQDAFAEAQSSGTSYLKEEVTEEDIARVVSRWTGIPVSKMLESEKQKLLDLEQRLRTRVVGQDACRGVERGAPQPRSSRHNRPAARSCS